jgi:hypothetical protein
LSSEAGPLRSSFTSRLTKPSLPAHFPSFAPPSETPFSLYRAKSAKASVALEDQATLLAGETKGVEFFSQNRDELVGGEEEKGGYACKSVGSSRLAGLSSRPTLLADPSDLDPLAALRRPLPPSPCPLDLRRYVLALHDPSTSTVTLVPAPTYLMAHTVKRLKRAPTAPLIPAQTTNMEARNKLGEAFGTRKAKTQIKTAERNKVDVEGMEGVRELMQEGIESGGAVLPTKGPSLVSLPSPLAADLSSLPLGRPLEEIKTLNDSSRPIPPPNMLAATPAEAYSLDDIISPAAATSLKFYVKELIEAETDEERIGMLAYRHSNWVNKRLNELCARDKPNKEKMCVPARQARLPLH